MQVHVSMKYTASMMSAKYFTVALCALLLLQGSAVAKPQPEERSLQSSAEELLAKLKELLANKIAEAKNTLGALIAKIKELANTIIGKGNQLISDEIAKLHATIEEIKSGSEVGKACVVEQEEAIKNLPGKLAQELISCVNSKVQQAEDIVKNVIKDVESVIGKFASIQDSFEQCANAKCYAQVIAEAASATVELPVKIAKEVKEAVKLIATLQSDVAACAANKGLEAATEVKNILGDIGKCVFDKEQNM